MENAWDYEWSSARRNAFGAADGFLVRHAQYLSLGRDEVARTHAYLQLLAGGICPEQIANIREHLKQEKVLGAENFQSEIADLLGRQVHVRPRGPPRPQA